MFRKISPGSPSDGSVTIEFEGERITASAGDTVAAVLLAHGVTSFRKTPVSDSARGPYCLMGVCFDCLLEIDGVSNSQGCMTQVRDGMKVARQEGFVRV